MLNKLGEYISLVNNKNGDESISKDYIKGISTNKEFIETKADLTNISVKNYKIVEPQQFAYVADTSRRGDKISLAFNETNGPILVSTISTIFEIKQSKREKLHPLFLYIYFNRPEFDRISRFNSWGSARETFSFEDLCDLRIEVPSMEIQQKYVDVYNALVANQKMYESGLEDLSLIMEMYIDHLKKKEKTALYNFINEVKDQNLNSKFKNKDVVGVSKNKEIIPTKSNTSRNDISKFIVIDRYDFVYNPRSADAIAINTDHNKALISWNNTAFRVRGSKKEVLLPEYLNLWFKRDEYSRWALFNSWGSSTEVLPFHKIKEYKIHIPTIKTQASLVNVFSIFEKRKEINEKLKLYLKEICPILIKGAIQESKGGI